MPKKTPDELIQELKSIFIERETRFLEGLLIIDTKERSKEEIELQEELNIQEQKFLKTLKSRLMYVEKLNNQLLGKTGKERKKGSNDIMASVVEMKSMVGEIVRQIPKTGTDDK